MDRLERELNMLLEYLEIDPIIRKYPDDLHKVQRAVYNNIDYVDLGYTFGDYPVGKFSPELRDVHIDLHNAILEGDV